MKKKLLFLPLILLILLASCIKPSFNGSRTGNNGEFWMEYSILNKSDYQILELEAGDELHIDVVSASGKIDLEVKKDGDTPIYTGTDVPTGAFSLTISESGSYKCTASGKSARGSIHFIREAASVLPESLYHSYYLSSSETAHAYLQNNSIRKFFDMWAEDYFEEKVEVEWNYDSLAPVQLLDHNFDSIAKSDEPLYTCTFTTDQGQYGYIIVSYNEEDPSVQKWSLHESPHLYDLRPNEKQLAAALQKTDIDLTTASAIRAEWIDTDKNRGDRIILFTDGKDDKYIYFYGDNEFLIEKQ